VNGNTVSTSSSSVTTSSTTTVSSPPPPPPPPPSYPFCSSSDINDPCLNSWITNNGFSNYLVSA